MDRVQAIAEFASSSTHSAGQSREAWRELPLDPGGELKAEAPQDKGYPDSKHHHGRQHESRRADPPIDRQCGKRFGKKNIGQQESRHRAEVEDPFHHPYRHLRRERHAHSPRDNVGTNQLPRAAQQSQPGKTDELRGHQRDPRHLLDRPQK